MFGHDGTDPALLGTWSVTMIDDQEFTDPYPLMRLSFLEGGFVGAGLYCNRHGGTFRTRSHNRIQLGMGPGTRAYCDDQDTEAAALLNSSKLYAVRGDTLVLTGGRAHIVLERDYTVYE